MWPMRDVGQKPRPVQQPRPPIWVGGSAAPSLRRAAEQGDGWLPQGTPRATDARADRRRSANVARRRSVDEPIDIGAITEILYVGEPSWDVGEHAFSGSPDRIAESLREFGAMGVDHLQVRFRSRSLDEAVDQIAAFGTEVGPLLQGAE